MVDHGNDELQGSAHRRSEQWGNVGINTAMSLLQGSTPPSTASASEGAGNPAKTATQLASITCWQRVGCNSLRAGFLALGSPVVQGGHNGMPGNEHLGEIIHNSEAPLARGSLLVLGIRKWAAHR